MRYFLLAACAYMSASELRAQTTTIDNVTIVDVTNGKLQKRKTILIEGGRIARIVNSSTETRAGATLDGVDLIKTQTFIPKEAYLALADEATRIGIPFEGHVPRDITATEAMNAHHRSFEHLIRVSDTNTTLIVELARNHVWQCPTVINSVGTAADFTSDPGVPFWLRHSVEGWRKNAMERLAATDSARQASQERARRRLEQIRMMYAAKVPFLAGTDAPQGYDLIPGASIHCELQLFVRAGLTPLQALQTATLNPAVYFNRTADFGTVAPGKIADLVVLARNPLVDIANTRNVVAVVADGRYYSSRDLDRLRLRIMELAGK